MEKMYKVMRVKNKKEVFELDNEDMDLIGLFNQERLLDKEVEKGSKNSEEESE